MIDQTKRVIFRCLILAGLVLTFWKCSNVSEADRPAACLPADNCDYYFCVSEYYTCDYVLNYGARYCNAFSRMCNNTLTSDTAQLWIKGTRICLQNEINGFIGDIDDCGTFRELAFTSHPYCYTEGAYEATGVGFCDLSLEEIIAVANCIRPQDFFTAETLDQIIRTLEICLSYHQNGGYKGSFDEMQKFELAISYVEEKIKSCIEAGC